MKKHAVNLIILLIFLSTVILSCDGIATLFHGPEPEPPPVTFTVTFFGNGADGIPPFEQTVNKGTIINLPDRGNLDNADDVFVGWNENPNGTGTTYSVGTPVTVTRNMIFYARWLDGSTPPCTVIFSANGANTGSPPMAVTAYSGVSITIPDQGTLACSGKTFGGWNTQPNGGGTNYAVGAPYTVTGNGVTLYAKWQSVIQFNVTYHANGATGTTPAMQTVDPETVITLPSTGNLTNGAKVFTGWNTQANGEGTSVL